jgi:hypothetical protein
MYLEVPRLACEEFRVKLSRDTGTSLSAADCARLLGITFHCKGGEQVTLQSNPGRYYVCLGDAIGAQTIGAQTVAVVVPNHLKVTWWCYREAAEVHLLPEGVGKIAVCYYKGEAGAHTRSLFSST